MSTESVSPTGLTRRAAVNVDVDGLYLYDRIHGYAGTAGNPPDFDAASADPRAWTVGVPRFLELFARAGVRATFFTVAQDLSHPEVRAVLADVVAAGHEIASHSLTHPYDLSRLPPGRMHDELQIARDRLQQATGQTISGFRAPGYVLSDALREAIVEVGHSYDSSRFPCPAYQAAKTGAIGLYAAQGRPSGSLPERPEVWVGPRKPYVDRLDSGRALLELPIGTLPGVRWPLIGTALVLGGDLGRLALQPIVAQVDWVNFECHAVDLMDLHGDHLPGRLASQPDLKVPLKSKWPILLKFIEGLRRSHEVQSLGQWAEQADRI